MEVGAATASGKEVAAVKEGALALDEKVVQVLRTEPSYAAAAVVEQVEQNLGTDSPDEVTPAAEEAARSLRADCSDEVTAAVVEWVALGWWKQAAC